MTGPTVPPDLDATLVLVRHGETIWNAEARIQGTSDQPLSELGERQADLVAKRLADPLAPPPLPVPAGDPIGCWCSPLRRAARVAERIVALYPQALPIHPDERLAEIGHGDWEGRRVAEIVEHDTERYLGWRSDPTRYHSQGGEPLADAAARVHAAALDVLRELSAARSPDGPGPSGRHHPWAVIVAHDGTLRLLLLRLLDLPLQGYWRFPFGQCAVSVIDVRAGRPMLCAHNLSEHLAPLAGGSAAEAPQEDRGAL